MTTWDLALGTYHDTPGLYGRPWQLSVYMMAYLSTHMTHSWTDSVQSHGIGWTYGSSPLAAHTCSHASLVGIQSMSSSNLVISIGHLTYVLVPIQHEHSTLWSNIHDTLRITSPKPDPIVQAKMQPALPECMTPVGEDPWYMVSKTDPP